jgi:hypothetical protein
VHAIVVHEQSAESGEVDQGVEAGLDCVGGEVEILQRGYVSLTIVTREEGRGALTR